MKELPILFNAEMVRAILDKDHPKTQTRRIVKWFGADGLNLNARSLSASNVAQEKWALMSMGASCWEERAHANSPYGVPGDRLWVREAWTPGYQDGGWGTIFRADGSFALGARKHEKGPYYHAKEIGDGVRWKPSIHMPRWASRITLEITDVRVQRVQEISEEDAQAEGVQKNGPSTWRNYFEECALFSPSHSFSSLWQSIYGKNKPWCEWDAWDANQWVWAYTFKRI